MAPSLFCMNVNIFSFIAVWEELRLRSANPTIANPRISIIQVLVSGTAATDSSEVIFPPICQEKNDGAAAEDE